MKNLKVMIWTNDNFCVTRVVLATVKVTGRNTVTAVGYLVDWLNTQEIMWTPKTFRVKLPVSHFTDKKYLL